MLYVGRKGNLGIAIEDVRGIANDPTHWIPYNDISFDSKAIKKELSGAFGSIQDQRNAVVVKKYAEGDFSADLDDSAIGVILSAVFGALPETTGTTNFIHQFKIEETNVHQSLSMFVQDPNISASFPLAMIDSFELTIEPEGIAQYKCTFKSNVGVDDNVLEADYSKLGNVFLHSDTTVKIAASENSLASSSAINVRKITLKIEKNVEDQNDLGSLNPGERVNKQFSVTSSIDFNFEDKTYRDLLLSDTNKAISITLSKSSNNSLAFILPQVSVIDWSPDKALDEIATQTVEFKGNWSSSADAIKATLKNQEEYGIEES